MHRHDLSLVAALAEGTLDDDRVARSRLETCPHCLAEYQAQRRAVEALDRMGSTTLTDSERAGLRSRVWSELRAGSAPVKATAPGYRRLSYAAVAALVLVLGVVGALAGGLGGGADERLAPAAMEEAEEPAADMAADDHPPDPLAVDPDEPDFFAREADRLRSGAFADGTARLFQADEAEDRELERCMDQAGLSRYQPMGEVIDDDITYIVAVPSTAEVAPATPVAFIDRSTCRLVAIDE